MPTLIVEIELGNDAMQTFDDAVTAIGRAMLPHGQNEASLDAGDEGRIRDLNGNTVGTWKVA